MFRKIVTVLRRLLVGLLGLLVLACIVGAAYQAYATRRDDRAFPPPGRMVDIGTHRLHLDCRGEGQPTILLEAAGQFWSSSWRHIHRDLSTDHRVCAYDRSGLGWSEEGPLPYDADSAVIELHRLLEAAGVSRPFVFVGHSLGGMLARIYDRRYPGEIAAAVYIDSGEPEILIDDLGAKRDAPIRPCGFSCRLQIGLAYLGVPRLVLANLGALDDPSYPPDALAEFRALASRPEYLRTALMIARNLQAMAFQTLDAGHIEDGPVLVLYSGNYGELVSAGEEPAEMARWKNAYVARWTHAVETSAGGAGPIAVPGANHITIVASRDHAAKVAAEIRGFVAETSR